MRKEVFFAIISGIIFGLVIAFGVWRANLILNKSDNTTTNVDQTATDSNQPSPTSEISVVKPEDNEVVLENPVTVSGITSSNSFIVISGEENDEIIKTNGDGTFEANVDVNPAFNKIIFTSFDENGASNTKNLNVVYSSEFAKQIEGQLNPSEETDSKTASESLQKKVENKLELAENRPKAFIGSITDIAENSIQLQNQDSEIGQISVDPEKTSFVSVDKTSKDIKFTDVAIGDYIAALGFVNDNDVLECQRLLVINPEETTDRTVAFGNVSDLDKKTITLDSNGESYSANFPRSWKGPEINEINIGDKVIMIYVNESGVNTIRTISIAESSTPSPSE